MPNLNVKQRVLGVNGLGQAGCPSMQQLQGIVDPTDPCQSPVASGTCPAGTTASFTQGPVGTGSTWTCVPDSMGTTITATGSTGSIATSTMATVAGIPTQYVIYGVIGLLVVMMLGRRR